MDSLRAIASEHSSQDLENHFVPLVKRLSQGRNFYSSFVHSMMLYFYFIWGLHSIIILPEGSLFIILST